jgi:integrase
MVDDPFDDRPTCPLRATTIRTRRHQILMAASALVHSGEPIEKLHGLADLVTADHFETALRLLRKRQDNNSTEALYGLAQGLLAIARHHVRVDSTTEARLALITRKLKRRKSGFRNKSRRRLAVIEDDHILAAILRLPQRLLDEARATQGRKRHLLAQMAVAIEILLLVPLRISNLSVLQVGSTIKRLSAGMRSHGTPGWLIALPASMVKNNVDLTFELSAEAGTRIEAAMALYEQPDGYLFPGAAGPSKHSSALSCQIKRIVESRVGIEWHTHLFRAMAGYLILRDNPSAFESVRVLLGNRDDQVIRENYAFLADRPLIAHAQSAIMRSRVEFSKAKTARGGN